MARTRSQVTGPAASDGDADDSSEDVPLGLAYTAGNGFSQHGDGYDNGLGFASYPPSDDDGLDRNPWREEFAGSGAKAASPTDGKDMGGDSLEGSVIEIDSDVEKLNSGAHSVLIKLRIQFFTHNVQMDPMSTQMSLCFQRSPRTS